MPDLAPRKPPRPMRLAALVAALCAIAPPGSAQQASGGLFPYEDAAALALGERLYSDHCAACHGGDLGGEPDWQTRDADGYLPAPPHDETGHTWHHPDAQLFAITKHGIEALVGGGYRSNMMGFGGVLTDAEILAVLAWIKSTWPERIIARHDEINAASVSPPPQ